MRTGRAMSASRGAISSMVLLGLAAMLSLVSGARVLPGPLVQEGAMVKKTWLLNRNFFFKRDQPRNGEDVVDMRANRLVKFGNSGEIGYWKVERRSPPGAKRNLKLPLKGGMDVLVLDIPEQGDRKDLIVSYEIPVTRGRYHPSSIMFASEGTIYVANSKEELVGASAAARKKIGTFSVDLPTLPPMIDRNLPF